MRSVSETTPVNELSVNDSVDESLINDDNDIEEIKSFSSGLGFVENKTSEGTKIIINKSKSSKSKKLDDKPETKKIIKTIKKTKKLNNNQVENIWDYHI